MLANAYLQTSVDVINWTKTWQNI